VKYDFLIETYETERIKVISAWSMFSDNDLSIRPNRSDKRGRNLYEHMVHQCVSEDTWFRTMLGIDVGAPTLPKEEVRLEFMRQYQEDSGQRLAALRTKDEGRSLVGRRDNVFRRTTISSLGNDSPHDSHGPSSWTATGIAADARPG
jgi:hypothetical protein